jgi:hypothetical protein
VGGEKMFTILWTLTVLAFMVERMLSVFFEHRLWTWIEKDFNLRGLKEVAAVALAYGLSTWSGFDALALMFQQPTTWPTRALTALVIAGGSKGAIKLMQDVLGIGNAATPARNKTAKG